MESLLYIHFGSAVIITIDLPFAVEHNKVTNTQPAVVAGAGGCSGIVSTIITTNFTAPSISKVEEHQTLNANYFTLEL